MVWPRLPRLDYLLRAPAFGIRAADERRWAPPRPLQTAGGRVGAAVGIVGGEVDLGRQARLRACRGPPAALAAPAPQHRPVHPMAHARQAVDRRQGCRRLGNGRPLRAGPDRRAADRGGVFKGGAQHPDPRNLAEDRRQHGHHAVRDRPGCDLVRLFEHGARDRHRVADLSARTDGGALDLGLCRLEDDGPPRDRGDPMPPPPGHRRPGLPDRQPVAVGVHDALRGGVGRRSARIADLSDAADDRGRLRNPPRPPPPDDRPGGDPRPPRRSPRAHPTTRRGDAVTLGLRGARRARGDAPPPDPSWRRTGPAPRAVTDCRRRARPGATPGLPDRISAPRPRSDLALSRLHHRAGVAKCFPFGRQWRGPSLHPSRPPQDRREARGSSRSGEAGAREGEEDARGKGPEDPGRHAGRGGEEARRCEGRVREEVGRIGRQDERGDRGESGRGEGRRPEGERGGGGTDEDRDGAARQGSAGAGPPGERRGARPGPPGDRSEDSYREGRSAAGIGGNRRADAHRDRSQDGGSPSRGQAPERGGGECRQGRHREPSEVDRRRA